MTPAPITGPNEIEAALTAFARQPNGGLVLLPSLMVTQNRDLIAKTALRLRLPSIYLARAYTASGGLMSYGFVGTEPFRKRQPIPIAFSRAASLRNCPCKRPASSRW